MDLSAPMSLPDRFSSTLIGVSVLLAGVLFLLPAPTSAQIEVRIGAKEGGHFATLLGGDRAQVAAPDPASADLGRRPGLIVGGVAVFDPSGPMAVQSEVLWIWKGVKSRTQDRETATKLNYIEVPILAKYRPPVSWGPVTAHLLAGPTVGFLTQAQREQTTTNASGSTRLTSRTKLGDSARALDVGVAVGGEVGYQFSDRARLMLELRYRRSLTQAFDGATAPDGTGPTPNTKNQGVAVTLGFVYSPGWSFSLGDLPFLK